MREKGSHDKRPKQMGCGGCDGGKISQAQAGRPRWGSSGYAWRAQSA